MSAYTFNRGYYDISNIINDVIVGLYVTVLIVALNNSIIYRGLK